MAEIVKHILVKPIQLADQVTKLAGEATSCKQECAELKFKTEKLLALLRQAARASSDLYERPTRRIINEIDQVLEKTLALVLKCRDNGIMKRLFTIIPATAFRKMSSQLENSVGDVSWLLRLSAPAEERGGEYLGLPPIAANEPNLCLVWEPIATLHTGTLEDRSDAAATLVSLALDNERNGKLIIEEGGILPLLRFVKEGKPEGQEKAIKAIGLLGRDPENVENMIQAGVCSVFAKILKESPMKVQAMAAWAVSELVANHPTCQDLFAQHNIIRLLVSHLAFETVQEHNKYNISSKATSISGVIIANKPTEADENCGHSRISHPAGNKTINQMHEVVANTMAMMSKTKPTQHTDGASHQPIHPGRNAQSNGKHNLPHSGLHTKGRDLEDPSTKAKMKAMAARALWQLAKDSSTICRSITESSALLCFAILLEKGSEEVQFNSAMALMEITSVAEKDPELRKSAFKPNTHACKAVVDQLLTVINREDPNLLIPCLKSIGNLARIFQSTETRIIGPLVRLLEDREAEVSREAAIALTKFTQTENYLHIDHSKAVIAGGGAKHLVQLLCFGEKIERIPALVLLCYISLHVPDSEELAQSGVLTALEWASKESYFTQDEMGDALLQEARGKMELYQSRTSRGFHQL